jgi:hypothetical protein
MSLRLQANTSQVDNLKKLVKVHEGLTKDSAAMQAAADTVMGSTASAGRHNDRKMRGEFAIESTRYYLQQSERRSAMTGD